MGIKPNTHFRVPERCRYKSRGRFMVHSWSNKGYSGFLSAVLVAIRAAKFQSVTIKMGAVTAEVASSSLVVPAIFLKHLAGPHCTAVEHPLNNVSSKFMADCVFSGTSLT